VSLALLFALPGLAGFALWLARPSARASRAASLLVASGILLLALHVLVATSDGAIVVHVFGDWRPPYGVAFAADRLSALFVALHAVLLLVTLATLRPAAHGESVVRRSHPLLLVLSMGLFGGFLTSDLFNLFVMFELVLATSYLLIQVPGTPRSLAAILPTLVVNLVASTLFLAGLALLYGMGGSVNVADLTRELGEAPQVLRRVALVMLIAAFATKAALVPLCFWMPATYPTLSAPLSALFAGIMTKLGVYALLRILPLVALDPLLSQLLVWAGGLSALLGVLAALSQYAPFTASRRSGTWFWRWGSGARPVLRAPSSSRCITRSSSPRCTSSPTSWSAGTRAGTCGRWTSGVRTTPRSQPVSVLHRSPWRGCRRCPGSSAS
jgi:multicomponent Na+:H+ antiporter subunit D